MSPLVSVYLPVGELLDLEKERARIDKEKARLESEIKRAEGKLNNPGFAQKAPQQVVEAERMKLDEFRQMLERTIAMEKALFS